MISVVIPLYNKEKYIAKTINTVLNQTFIHFELIIVNDGSTDNSLDIVKTFTDDRILILNQINSGESAARNSGIKEAKYNYVAFLDADDTWNNEYLASIFDIISEYPNCSIYSTNYGFISKNKFKLAHNSKYYKQKLVIDNYFLRSIDVPLITSNTAVVKKNVFYEIGFFDESLKIGPDLEMWFRIMKKYNMAFHPYIGAIYNLDACGRVMNTSVKPNFEFIFKLLKNIEYTNNYYIHQYVKEVAIRELLFVSKQFNSKLTYNTLDVLIKNKVLSKMWKLIYYFPFRFVSFWLANKLFLFKIKFKFNYL